MLVNDKTIAHSDTEALQLPDIRFITYCFESYGLNRGVYNTIDEWLYDAGYTSIVQRREALLSFLAASRQSGAGVRQQGLLKFGKGGLTKQLHDFLASDSRGRYEPLAIVK